MDYLTVRVHKSIVDIISDIMEDKPKPMRNFRKAERWQTGADKFRVDHPRLSQRSSIVAHRNRVKAVNKYNSTHPVLHERLKKKRSTTRVTVASRKRNERKQKYDSDCEVCVRLAAYNKWKKSYEKRRCPRRGRGCAQCKYHDSKKSAQKSYYNRIQKPKNKTKGYRARSCRKQPSLRSICHHFDNPLNMCVENEVNKSLTASLSNTQDTDYLNTILDTRTTTYTQDNMNTEGQFTIEEEKKKDDTIIKEEKKSDEEKPKKHPSMSSYHSYGTLDGEPMV